MVIAEKPIAPHAERRDRLYAHSGKMVREGDRLQASEKAWGAVAHALKIVAERRNWPYAGRSDAKVIIKHIADLTGNYKAVKQFDDVEELHGNYYADVYPMEDIKTRRASAKELLAFLKKANSQLPRDEEGPTERRYRNRHARRQAQEAPRAAAAAR